MTWTFMLLDVFATIFTTSLCANAPQSTLLSRVCPTASTAHGLSAVSPFFAFGAITVLLSALLRKSCYRALGHLFTFEITIRPTHVLVTTGQCYSVPVTAALSRER